jgi:hypothetical protein
MLYPCIGVTHGSDSLCCKFIGWQTASKIHFRVCRKSLGRICKITVLYFIFVTEIQTGMKSRSAQGTCFRKDLHSTYGSWRTTITKTGPQTRQEETDCNTPLGHSRRIALRREQCDVFDWRPSLLGNRSRNSYLDTLTTPVLLRAWLPGVLVA